MAERSAQRGFPEEQQMTHRFLISTAAAALLAGTVFAAAQGAPRQAPSSGGAPAQGEQTQPAEPRGQGQPQGQPPSQSQPSQAQTPQQGQTKQGQAPQQGQTKQGETKQGAQQQKSGSSSASFTTEQRTKIRETVLRGNNAPRVTNVNFSVRVGTAVPNTVRVVAVPDVIIEVHPEWRGHMYFLVNDQIIIVDRNHKIVAVIDV
jgi:hypothetical protein